MKEFKQIEKETFDSFLSKVVNSKIGEVYACQRQPSLAYAVQINKDFMVYTLQGVVTSKAGNYLVMSSTGGLWPVEKDFFEENYYKLHRLDPQIPF